MISFKKKFANRYNKVAPNVIPTTANNRQNNFPKIKPANNANGDPNPAAKTHKVENKMNIMPNKNTFDCLSS